MVHDREAADPLLHWPTINGGKMFFYLKTYKEGCFKKKLGQQE